MDKAILVVSFGTSYEETREKTIGAIEKTIAYNFKEYKIVRAFTSSIIMKKLKKQGIVIDNVEEALSKLKAEGVREVIIQPTHIIPGDEYDKVKELAEPFKNDFDRLVIGEPLLSSNDDYIKVAKFIENEITNEEGAVVLMGHGSEHVSNIAYTRLQNTINREDIFIGTVEAEPTLDDVLAMCDGYNNVLLTPFMIVAGDHAINDMASDDKESWKSEFIDKGFHVKIALKGLGEYEFVRELFVEHIRRSI